MKLQVFVSKFLYCLKLGVVQGMASVPSSSSPSSRTRKLEGKKHRQRDRSRRSKSPETQALSTSSHHGDMERDRSGRSKSSSLPPRATSPRRGRRPNEYDGDDQSNSSSKGSRDYQFEYESPTESLASSLSSFPVDRTSSTHKHSTDRREKDHLKDESKRGSTMSKKTTSGVSSSGDGTMIEVSKVTALVEEELRSQRDKHKDQLNRTMAKFKDRRENFEREIDELRGDCNDARRELEKCKRSHASQKRAAERNDRFQSQQKNRIDSLEEQKELLEELQEERDTLLDEVGRSQQQQQKTIDELSTLKVRVREDSQKRLSVMESLSTSWDSEQKEAKEKEILLITELDIMSKTLKAEKGFLKNKSKEFAQLEAQYRSTKTELRSIKMTIIAKKEEMDEDLKRERESRRRASIEHNQTLKLKNDEIYTAHTTIRTMKAELKSRRENFASKEKSMARSVEGMKISKEKSDVVDPEVKTLREENSLLNAEIKEMQKQVESYLANMALQQEFCDSLKSRIYKEQEKEQEQGEEIHKLRKRIKKQQKEAAEKDLQIDQLKQLPGNSSSDFVKVQSKSSRDLKGGKRSSLKKSKLSSGSNGYRTS